MGLDVGRTILLYSFIGPMREDLCGKGCLTDAAAGVVARWLGVRMFGVFLIIAGKCCRGTCKTGINITCPIGASRVRDQ